MSQAFYRAVVYEVDDTTVDFTIGSDEVVSWPDRFGGQRVKLLQGKAESLNYQIAIKPSALTGQLSDAEGRAELLQRRIDFQVGGADITNLLEVTPANITGLPGYSFSRTGTATYTDENGIIQTAADGELRNSDYAAGVRRIFTEGASTNIMLDSEDFEPTGTAWTVTYGSPVVAQNDAGAPDGAATADKITQDIPYASINQIVSGVANDSTSWTLSVFMKKDTGLSADVGIQLQLIDGTQVDTGITFFDAGTGVVSSGNGIVESVNDDWWRVYDTAANNSSGNTRAQSYLYASYDGAASQAVTVWGAQLENLPFPTSYIPTAGAAVTRNADSLSVDFTAVPQEMTVQTKGINRGTFEHTSGTYLWATGSGGTARLFSRQLNNNSIKVRHIATAGDVSSFAVTSAVVGDTLEARSVLNSNGSVLEGTSVNGAAEVLGTTSAANALDGSWSATTLHINESGAANQQGYFAFESIRIATGVQSMADMRQSSFAARAAGRIMAITQRESDLAYLIEIGDERFIERNTVIFTEASTTKIFPPGEVKVHDLFLPIAGRYDAEVTAASTDGTANLNFQEIRNLNERLKRTFDDDLRPGFQNRSLANGETRYRRLTLHLTGNTTSDTFAGDYPVRDINDGSINPLSPLADRRLEVIDSAGTLSPSTTTRRGYLYLKKAPPSEDLPLHIPSDTIFGFNLDPRFNFSKGIHPFQLVKDIYDGQFQQTVVTGSTELVAARTVRYSTETLSTYDPDTNPEGLIDNPKYPIVRFRITESETMADFLQKSIFQPFNVLPIIDGDGKVRLTDFSLPTAETVESTTGLFQFTTANTISTPTWQHNARDQLTAIRYRFPRYDTGVQGTGGGTDIIPTDNAGIDLIIDRDHEEEFRHARLDAGTLTRREVIRDIPGTDTETAGQSVADINAAELFERYGDGPQETRISGTTAASTVKPGELVVVNIPGFVNTANSTRGGSVVMQATAKIPRPWGYSFDLLHVGDDLQPLSIPSIDVQRSGVDPRHTIRLSVSGWSSTADVVVYQLADTTGAPGSTDWRNVGSNQATIRAVDISGDPVGDPIPRFTDIGNLKSGTKFHGRARLIRTGRIGSNWSTAGSTTTDAMAAPTVLASTQQGATYIDLSWQVGETAEPVEVLNPTTSLVILSANSNIYRDIGLIVNTTHGYRVRHRDPFGGLSAATTQLSVATSTDPALTLNLAPPAELVLIGNNVIAAT